MGHRGGAGGSMIRPTIFALALWMLSTVMAIERAAMRLRRCQISSRWRLTAADATARGRAPSHQDNAAGLASVAWDGRARIRRQPSSSRQLGRLAAVSSGSITSTTISSRRAMSQIGAMASASVVNPAGASSLWIYVRSPGYCFQISSSHWSLSAGSR